MSVEFNWENLLESSDQIETALCDFLHEQFQALKLPPFISSLSVSNFKLGSVPPEVILRDLSDPYPEFYEQNDENDASDTESDSTCVRRGSTASVLTYSSDTSLPDPVTKSSEFDSQALIEFKYAGDMELGIMATLLVNYPSPSFISLPFSIKVTNIKIHSLIAAAFVEKRIHISVMSDLDDDQVALNEQASVIRGMRIESEIGDDSGNGAVLKDVGKVEKFVLEQLRNVIRDEIVWPGWITLEL